MLARRRLIVNWLSFVIGAIGGLVILVTGLWIGCRVGYLYGVKDAHSGYCEVRRVTGERCE